MGKEFKKHLFAEALHITRSDKFGDDIKKYKKSLTIEKKPFSKKWYRAISFESLVDEATVRNCFLAKYDGSATTILRLCEWANLNINDFYK